MPIDLAALVGGTVIAGVIIAFGVTIVHNVYPVNRFFNRLSSRFFPRRHDSHWRIGHR